MPVNDIIADLDSGKPWISKAPEETYIEEVETPEETTMRTRRMMPPYLHIQTLSENSATLWTMVATVLSLAGYVSVLQ